MVFIQPINIKINIDSPKGTKAIVGIPKDELAIDSVMLGSATIWKDDQFIEGDQVDRFALSYIKRYRYYLTQFNSTLPNEEITNWPWKFKESYKDDLKCQELNKETEC